MKGVIQKSACIFQKSFFAFMEICWEIYFSRRGEKVGKIWSLYGIAMA